MDLSDEPGFDSITSPGLYKCLQLCNRGYAQTNLADAPC